VESLPTAAAKQFYIDRAIKEAEFILERIDKNWLSQRLGEVSTKNKDGR